ncbi:MAG TPA: T9SS type A sorting domain-containing protein [Candidatus Kapabacteria bacterium]|nr:T9SS type A sorting domain-containing protein [Candidatus Kapabacteria bacterium]
MFRRISFCIVVFFLCLPLENAFSQMGGAPGLFTQSVDYGTHLYGTTKDSFAIVQNTGGTQLLIHRFIPYGPDSADFVAYPYGKGYTDSTSNTYIQYPDTNLTYAPGVGHQYPYHFVARKLGSNLDSMKLVNDLDTTTFIELTANVVQPHLWGQDVSIYDTLPIGDTLNATSDIGNSGTAVLIIDTINIEGPDAFGWRILSIKDSLTGDPIPWPLSQHLYMAPNDVWNIKLQFIPWHLGIWHAWIQVTGSDAFGRHSNDSIVSFYNWGNFPYDTIINLGVTFPPSNGVNGNNNETPHSSDIILSQNYPNPFSLATTFTFTAPQGRDYRVEIYNNLGARIASLQTSEVQPGKYSAAWSTNGWASGVYYYRVSTEENRSISGAAKSFLLLR